MLVNNKIAYIFTSYNTPYLYDKKLSFFKKIKLKFKKEKVLENIKDENFLSFINYSEKYSQKKIFPFLLNNENKDEFIDSIEKFNADIFYVFSTYPQMNSKTFEISNFFKHHFPSETIDKLFWVKSYFSSSIYINSLVKKIRKIILKNKLNEKNLKLIFLAEKDPFNNLYNFESKVTSQNIIKYFPYSEGETIFYDEKNIKKILEKENNKNTIFIQISSILEDKLIVENFDNKPFYYITSLIEDSFFIRSIFNIIEEKNFITNEMLNIF